MVAWGFDHFISSCLDLHVLCVEWVGNPHGAVYGRPLALN